MSPRSVLVAVTASVTITLSVTSGLIAGAAPAIGEEPDKTAPTTAPVATTVALPTTTLSTTTTAAPGTGTAGPSIGDVVDVGEAKPARFYDAYLAAALADIQLWWGEEYTRLFGEPYDALAGGIFAAYPERVAPIPGCGFPANTTYQEVTDFGAFYCPDGDYMAYDDGEQGVIFQLAQQFSPSVVAVVLAHEFGHAIQARSGVLDQDVPTIYTEQQADCFAGAWARRVWEGRVPGLTFGDEDIRTGLIALVAVRDPIGPSVFDEGGHGSAFDRIGAFQEGFIGTVDHCVGLIEKPLPLLNNEFGDTDEALVNGNARFGWEEGQLFFILNRDLETYWPATMTGQGITLPSISTRPSADPLSDNCGDPKVLSTNGAIFCAVSGEVIVDDATARERYDDFGDFAVGYGVGLAWAEAIQSTMASPLQGESRALTSDCLVGAWIGSALPPAGTPGATDNHSMRVSPGDLDEAVQTALVIGDHGLDDNVVGSAFEKIAAMRRGVLDGLGECIADISGG